MRRGRRCCAPPTSIPAPGLPPTTSITSTKPSCCWRWSRTLPECASDFLEWQPLSYAEHFTASNFRARDLAIEAYETADAAIRAEFDQLTDSMTKILTEVGAAMRQLQQDKSRVALAEQAIVWVKPLVMQTAGIINGAAEADVDSIMAGA
ncbi:hypothetical protein ACVIM8_006276 [Bradyrhizobium sp. USDA 4529]